MWSRKPTPTARETSPARRPRLRLPLLLGVGAALIAGALLLRESSWARERTYAQLPSSSLSLIALERPKDPLVFRYLGQRLLAEGDLEGSYSAFRAAVALTPGDAESQLGLGVTLMEGGKPYDAEASFVKAAELRPKDWRPHFKLAELYSRHRNATSTIAPLEKVTELDPGNAEAWYRLGMAAGDLHDWDRSLTALQRAVRLNPRRPEYLRDLAQVQMQFGRSDEARASLLRAREIDPKDVGTLVLLGRLELALPPTRENLDSAHAFLEQARQSDDQYAPVYRELGTLYLRRAELPKAISALRRAVKLDTSDGQSLLALGQALIRAGQRAEGERLTRAFTELSESRRTVRDLEDRIHQAPKNPDLRLRMARTYRRYGRDDRAVNQYQVYLSMAPADRAVAKELQLYVSELRAAAPRTADAARAK